MQYLNNCLHMDTYDKDAKDKINEKDSSEIWKMTETNLQS